MDSADKLYYDELERIVDSVEAKVASEILRIALSEESKIGAVILAAAGQVYSIENAVTNARKKNPNIQIDSALAMSVVPAVIQALDLQRKNKSIGSTIAIAKHAVAQVIADFDKYYSSHSTAGMTSSQRSASAIASARWLTRNAIFIAQREAAKKLGQRKKRWVTMHDNRVRTTHKMLDGTSVSVNDVFRTNQGELRFPGDTTAPIGEWINCRCLLKYH